MYSRTKTKRVQNLVQSPIVATVPGRIECNQLRVPLLIDVEPRDEVVGLDPVRRGQRRNEQIAQSWRIILARAAARARPNTTAFPRSLARPDSAASPRSSARCPRVAGTLSRSSRNRSRSTWRGRG